MPETSAATASASTSAASTKTAIVRSRLAPISANPFATSHERRGDGEPGEREQPREGERVVADAQVRRVGPERHEQYGGRDAGRRDRRRETVDEPGTLDVHGALAPQAAKLAVRLERRRPAPALEPRLPVLDEPRQERRQRDAARHLRDRRRRRCAAHPMTPSFAAPSTTSTSPTR